MNMWHLGTLLCQRLIFAHQNMLPPYSRKAWDDGKLIETQHCGPIAVAGQPLALPLCLFLLGSRKAFTLQLGQRHQGDAPTSLSHIIWSMTIASWLAHQRTVVYDGLIIRLRRCLCGLARHPHIIIQHVHARTLKALLTLLRLLVQRATMSDSLSDIAARKQEKDAVRCWDSLRGP
jgi:hypothetical protein